MLTLYGLGSRSRPLGCHGSGINDGHRPVVYFDQLDGHFRDFPDVPCDHVEVACQQNERFAVRAFFERIDFCDGSGIGGVAAYSPDCVGGVEKKAS